GWTRIGAHLYTGQPRQMVSYDWARWNLPRNIGPGETFSTRLLLPAVSTPGDYSVVVDLVTEGIAWFAGRESAALTIALKIR
ncbi:MAG: hypothetical protein ABL961_09705, partial [Vicinamibacterales bacterium]